MGLNILKSMRNEKSDLDLAWKMLDNARAIVEKSPADQNMEKVKIFSALAATSMERGILSNIYFILLITVLNLIGELLEGLEQEFSTPTPAGSEVAIASKAGDEQNAGNSMP
jgi:hypothetical protein